MEDRTASALCSFEKATASTTFVSCVHQIVINMNKHNLPSGWCTKAIQEHTIIKIWASERQRDEEGEKFQTTKAHFCLPGTLILMAWSIEQLMTSNDNTCSIKDQAISRIESHIKKYAGKKHIFVVKSWNVLHNKHSSILLHNQFGNSANLGYLKVDWLIDWMFIWLNLWWGRSKRRQVFCLLSLNMLCIFIFRFIAAIFFYVYSI